MKTFKRILIVFLLVAAVGGIGFWLRPVEVFNQITYLREGLSGVESKSVEVIGYNLHYLAEGPAGGPVVVLVHGLGGSAEDWTNLAPWLARAGFRVYMPDLPGYGRSPRPAEFSYSVADEAEIVAQFFDAMGLKQVDLGGISMGGAIVQHVAARHPDRIRRLMLFDAAGINDKPAWDTRLFTPQSAAELDQLDALLMPHPPQIPAFVTRDILRRSHQNQWVIQRAMAAMLTGRDATDTLLPKFKMPVLIVWGAEDRIIPLADGEKIHQLVPQSRLEVIPGCGHLAPIQCAEPIGPKVVDFLK